MAWGGLGAAPEAGAIRGWPLRMRGDDESWANSFRYTTYETGYSQGTDPAPVWVGADGPEGSPTSKIKATYRVRLLTVPHRPTTESSALCICGKSCRKMSSSQ